jgi:hypothetical protein
MVKEINIEKALYPKKNVLKQDKEGTLTSTIIDDELDSIKCTFNYDGCVELDTEGYSYLSLSIANLYELINLINKAEKRYSKMKFE